MRQTVVGVFDRHAAARQAAQELRDSGFADSVFVTDDPESSAASGTSDGVRRDDGGVMASVRNFFSDLFDNDDDREVRPYAEAVRRGGAVVKVEVDDEADADAARSALVAAGAVDIEERADAWRADGWDEGTSLDGDAPTTSAGLDPTTGNAAAFGGTTTTTSAGSARLDDDAAGSLRRDDDAMRAGRLDPDDDAGFATTGRGDTRRDERIAGVADTEVIPVVKEELQVGKRVVSTGGVRVYARTLETPVHESVTLRSEHAEVARRPVDRPATEADLARGERTIEVRETAEEAVVAKESRVVEEVVVGKTTESRTEEIRETLRNTEVEVEKIGAESRGTASAWDPTPYRSDFDRQYAGSGGRWDEYEPAYRYGHTMREHPQYAGRDWDEVEPGLRSDWETRHPGGTWERFKAAVRRGWDRMTG